MFREIQENIDQGYNGRPIFLNESVRNPLKNEKQIKRVHDNPVCKVSLGMSVLGHGLSTPR